MGVFTFNGGDSTRGGVGVFIFNRGGDSMRGGVGDRCISGGES